MQKTKSLKWLMMATLFMFSALTTFTMTSCSDDDDDDAESVVGIWKQKYTTESGEEITDYYIFNADGKFYNYYIIKESDKTYLGEPYEGTWEQSGNKVVVTGNDEDGETEKFELTISGSKLTIAYEVLGETVTEEFTRTTDDVEAIIASLSEK